MKNKGINDVSALFGGFDAWTKLGYPTQQGL
jgi:rhodanese-related sulfurtransferase